MVEYVVVAGNVVDGFVFHGPFPYAEDANYWADLESETAHGLLHGVDWTVAKLRKPRIPAGKGD